MMKKVIILVLAISCIMACLSLTVYATDTESCVISVESAIVSLSTDEFSINVSIKNNPGMGGIDFRVYYDDNAFTLKNAVSNIDGYSFTAPQNLLAPATFLWDTQDYSWDSDGAFLTLYFTVSVNVDEGDYNIKIEYDEGNIFDFDMKNVSAIIENGTVTVTSYTPGDVNNDGIINAKDITLIRRYISDGRVLNNINGYNISLNENAADVNGDGVINAKDITNIRRYIADGRKTDPNSYNITLLPSKIKCSHILNHVEANEATCTEDGNKEYWHCDKCGKYFGDAEGKYEIPAIPVITALGHTYSDNWAYDEEYHWYAATCEHKDEIKNKSEHTFVDHVCSVCGYKEKLTVTFLDYNNSIIDMQEVAYGESASAPGDPYRQGYVFAGWDTSFAEISEELTIKAVYIKQYTVEFVDYDGTILKTQIVASGSNAIPPSDPIKKGYTFSGWSTSYENITSDTTVTALYIINSYDVTFVMPDGTVIPYSYLDTSGKEQQLNAQKVEFGFSAVVPEYPEYYFDWENKRAYGFTKWVRVGDESNEKPLDEIVGDTIVMAVYDSECNVPTIALQFSEDNNNVIASLTVCLPEGYGLYGANISVNYDTEIGNLVINNAEVISSSSLYLVDEDGKNANQIVVNNKTKSFKFAWSDGGGKFFTYSDVLTFEIGANEGAVVNEETFRILEESILIIGTVVDNLQKITPIVVYR